MHITTLKAGVPFNRETLWSLLAQVKHWATWDPDIEDVKMTGPFKQGAKGSILFKDGSKQNFCIVKLQPLESLVLSVTYQHGTELLVKWDLSVQDSLTVVEQDVTLSGAVLSKMLVRNHKDQLKNRAAVRMRKMFDVAQGTQPQRQGPLSGRSQPTN
ncbi:hypothetical protein [Deinococcus roseus]|uniref:Polyketide cyclase n=1 Tax=Deinococcus roseus TaxID=392414 RepID=A0ABQ2D2L2_9DEIO|nr:hypothetical protein [Deinococcus roseus]GGJ43281.1 hypothetical protein GCM10008938_31930 [Deinococcus roseus]